MYVWIIFILHTHTHAHILINTYRINGRAVDTELNAVHTVMARDSTGIGYYFCTDADTFIKMNHAL